MDKDEVKLLPCPFCGGEGLPQSHPGNPMITGWFHSIECQSCFGGTFHFADTKEKAIEAWNSRPTTASRTLDKQSLVKLINNQWPKMGILPAKMLADAICKEFSGEAANEAFEVGRGLGKTSMNLDNIINKLQTAQVEVSDIAYILTTEYQMGTRDSENIAKAICTYLKSKGVVIK